MNRRVQVSKDAKPRHSKFKGSGKRWKPTSHQAAKEEQPKAAQAGKLQPANRWPVSPNLPAFLNWFRRSSVFAFWEMIHRLFAICDLSAHNSASFDRAGNDAVLLQFSQTCDWLLIWAKWSSAEEAQLQISTFCERRSATTLSEYTNHKHFDFLYKPAMMNSSDGRDFSATSFFT